VRRGIAIIGASDRNLWTGAIKANLEQVGYPGEVWPVNRRHTQVCGLAAYGSVGDLPGPIDAAIVAVRVGACPDVVRQVVETGCRDVAVITDGFAERGQDGAKAQQDLIRACRADTRLYGPNCLGFADYYRRICAIASPIAEGIHVGGISVISQSGGLLVAVIAAIQDDDGGLDWCASLGNAAAFDLAAAIDFACARDTTRVLCVYAESLGRRPAALSGALARARFRRVRVIMLKAGRSSKARGVALSHTASAAGEDQYVDAFLERNGVMRVDSLEELARAAVVAEKLGADRPVGGLLAIGSGGASAVCSDLAAQLAVRLSVLSGPARSLLSEAAAPGSYIDNPLDLLYRPGLDNAPEAIYPRVFDDNDVSLILSLFNVPFPDGSPSRAMHRALLGLVAQSAHATGKLAIICALTSSPWTEWIREFRQANKAVLVVQGLALTLRVLARFLPAGPEPPRVTDRPAAAVLGESHGRAALQDLGFPVVPGLACRSRDEAVKAFDTLRGSVVVKLDIRGLVHKAEVGAVTLGCASAEEVASAVTNSMAQCAELGIDPADIVAILVEEMVIGGELLVGLSRSSLGAFLTVGPGGAGAGREAPATTVMLPAPRREIEQLCEGALQSEHSGPALTETASIIDRLAIEFAGGGLTQYELVEINPLMVTSTQAMIADVLMVPARSESPEREENVNS
jgi:acyl-CoA synthetase (NDP forming)